MRDGSLSAASTTGGYDFSQIFHASTLAFSPGSTFLATAHNDRIIIRSTATLAIVRTFQCIPDASTATASSSKATSAVPNLVVDQLLWSNDSLYLIAYSKKISAGWLFGLTAEGRGEGGEVARLGGQGTVEGLVHVEWGKGDREVLTWSKHGLCLTIYDLMTGETRYIQHPKSASGCHTYSPDSRYLATVERHSGRDHIGVYDVLDDYALLRHFPLGLVDVEEISWSPCGRYIAAVDGSLNYALHVYSPLGPLLVSHTPSSPSFSGSPHIPDPGLGIRCSAWAPGGRWIALGGWEGKVRIIESESGNCIATMNWPNRTIEKDTVVWKEPEDWLRDTRGYGIVQFERSTTPSLPILRPDLSTFPPRSGVSQLAFDAEATTFLVRLETQPNVVHIHSFLPEPHSASPEINHVAALVFSQPVRTAKWCSNRRKLVVSTRSGAVFFWDGDEGWLDDGNTSIERSQTLDGKGGMSEGVGIPTRIEFKASEAMCSPDGYSVAIIDKKSSQFCMLYEDPPVEPVDLGSSSFSSVPDTPQRRWDGVQELSHVLEEDELEADQSVLNSLAEIETSWMQSRLGAIAA